MTPFQKPGKKLQPMNTQLIETTFWIFLSIVFYTYIGYGILLYILVWFKRRINPLKKLPPSNFEPHITLLVAAYNEKDFVNQKVLNTKSLDYPSDKIHQIWITDGSTDGTPDILTTYSDVKVYHENERKGKIAAMNRGMQYVTTDIVIFSDANTLLGSQSVRKIVQLFENPKTGCVSGEKRIVNKDSDAAAGAGEGIYWRYESTLKKWDAELYSVVGAAGELFAIRTHLYQEVEPDTILDDFVISLRIAMQGYTIQYDPDAYAIENSSANVNEERKRKIRIAAGGIQSIIRLLPLLNIFKYGILSFQYISHRVLRWTLTPLLLPWLPLLNLLLIRSSAVYQFLFILQFIFYVAAFIGWLFRYKKTKFKLTFISYYFFMMNYSVYQGFTRFLKNTQSVQWERARRADAQPQV